uniref:Immunoglobulin V-set domain-containing protein n=1 Tax=Cyprinus carpio TaxID=7962 RepID=A0A8C1UGG0_CYPCA
MTKWLIITLLFTTHDFMCWGQDSVEQPLRENTSAEGNQVTLLCNYTLMSSANAYLFLYKQLQNRSQTFILSDISIGKGTTEPEFQERFDVKLDSTLGTVPLMIQDDVRVSDSAVYYCALRPTVTEAHSTFIQKSCVHKFSGNKASPTVFRKIC